jgi:hypothetical protein
MEWLPAPRHSPGYLLEAPLRRQEIYFLPPFPRRRTNVM